MKKMGYNACALFCGAAIGAAIALLLAPQSGERTRKMIGDMVDDGIEKARKGYRKIEEMTE